MLLRSQTDDRLLELANAGHERAFEALVVRYRKPLVAYCRRLLLSESRAEDVVQQAFLSAWTSLAAGSDVQHVRAWLYRITHNAALNARKRSGYDYVELHEALHGADAPEEDLERRSNIRETLAAMAALPELQREALIRTAVDGDSYDRVAQDLGLSGTVVRGLVYRARVSVRTAATAITPLPLLVWSASRGSHAIVASRVAELVAGSGSVGMGAILVKGGAVVAAAGAIATGTGALPAIVHATSGPADQSRASHAAARSVQSQVLASQGAAAKTVKSASGSGRPAAGSSLATVALPGAAGAAAAVTGAAGLTDHSSTGSDTGSGSSHGGSGGSGPGSGRGGGDTGRGGGSGSGSSSGGHGGGGGRSPATSTSGRGGSGSGKGSSGAGATSTTGGGRGGGGGGGDGGGPVSGGGSGGDGGASGGGGGPSAPAASGGGGGQPSGGGGSSGGSTPSGGSSSGSPHDGPTAP